MSEPQTLEEAWSKFVGELNKVTFTGKHPRDAARAVALAGFDAGVVAGGSTGKIVEQIERQRERRRQIEELGA